jgi:cytoskeletal protein CcmA (bactofilin family)
MLKKFGAETENEKVNNILKGSKLLGDIIVTCDTILSGDIEGNITSKQDSNIVIKGTCTGNIETKGGNVDIEGELRSGNITTDGNVSISGKFKCGEVKAKGKIYVNCEFQGKLEGNEVELGSNAQVKGELFYKEYISISKGAKVEVQLCRIQEEPKAEKKSPEKEVVDIKSPVKELIEVK